MATVQDSEKETIIKDADLIPEEKGDNSQQLKKPAKVVSFAEAVEEAELIVKHSEREKCLKTLKWVTCGLLAGLCMGVGAFIFATNFGNQGINGLGMIGPGTFLIILIVRLSIQIRYRAKHGRWFKSQDSRVFKDDGSVKLISLAPLLVNMMTNVGYFYAMAPAWDLAKYGGLNQGVISTLLSLTAMYNIFIFYFAFSEKITWPQGVGVGLMIVCICCLGLETNSKRDELEEDLLEDGNGRSQFFNCSMALLIGNIAPWLMSMKQYTIRRFKSGFSAFDQSLDSGLIEFLIYSLHAIVLIRMPDFDFFDWRNLVIGTISGVLIQSGRLFIAIAVSEGIAAPAQALMSTHALHQTFWSTVVAKQKLSLFQYLGVTFGFVAVFCLSTLDYLIQKMRTPKSQKEPEDETSRNE